MDAPFLQIKCAVLAAAAQHKEKLLEECLQHAIDGTDNRDVFFAQSLLVLLGLDAARALIAEWMRRATNGGEKADHCRFLVRRQMRFLSTEEFLELTKEYLASCKLSSDPYTAQIQLMLIQIAREKHRRFSPLHGLISNASSLLQQAAKSSDSMVRELVAQGVHLILPKNQSLAILRTLAEDPDERVRSEAEYWLSQL